MDIYKMQSRIWWYFQKLKNCNFVALLYSTFNWPPVAWLICFIVLWKETLSKGTLALYFLYLFKLVFAKKNPSDLTINNLKYFFNWLWICHEYFHALRVPQHKNGFIPGIISIWTVPFCIFRERHNEDAKRWKNSAFYLYMHSFIPRSLIIWIVSLCIFSLQVKFHFINNQNK